MPLLTGINHVAVMSADVDRFVAFYTEVFDADVVFEESTPFRHALVRVGEGCVLHAIEAAAGAAEGRGSDQLTRRGHLDHLGLDAPTREVFDAVRARLEDLGATDGTVFDLGPQLSIWCTDPDGMELEVCWNRDRALRGFHAPSPLEPATG